MSNGKPWDPNLHTPILKAWAGRISDKEIGTITGHSERAIRQRRTDLGLPAYHWRQEVILLAAAGEMSLQNQ